MAQGTWGQLRGLSPGAWDFYQLGSYALCPAWLQELPLGEEGRGVHGSSPRGLRGLQVATENMQVAGQEPDALLGLQARLRAPQDPWAGIALSPDYNSQSWIPWRHLHSFSEKSKEKRASHSSCVSLVDVEDS